MKFGDYIEEWKLHCRVKVGNTWRVGQDQVIRDHILPFLCNRDIRDIKQAHISFVLEQAKNRGFKANTQRKVYLMLSKLFRDAVEFFEIIQKSPVKKRYHALPAEKVIQPFLKPLDAWVFLEYVMQNDSFGKAVWLQTLAGLRVSEVQALTWEDVDFKSGVIRVVRSYKRTIDKIESGTKNKEPHIVPMTPTLQKYLHARRERTGYVVKNTTGGMMSYYSYRSFISRTVKN
jgi:integrase